MILTSCLQRILIRWVTKYFYTLSFVFWRFIEMELNSIQFNAESRY